MPSKITALVFLAIIAGWLPLSAQNDSADFSFRLERLQYVYPGHNQIVNIIIDRAVRGMSEINLRIGYDTAVMKLIDVMPGTFISACGLEYFRYYSWPVDSEDVGFPTGVVGITAKYESGDPYDWGIKDYYAAPGETIASLKFLISDNRDYLCTFHPIQFLWTGCGDNKVYSITGDTIYISNTVYDTGGVEITKDTLLPSYTGAPSICIRGIPEDYGKDIQREIDFQDGGLRIICADSIEEPRCGWLYGWHGDIGGWDGIGGLVIFMNYFRYGISAFTIDPVLQANCTDVNGDGKILTIEDFQYLVRIITGDALSPGEIDTTFEATLRISEDKNAEKVSVFTNSDTTLGSIYLCFSAPDSLIRITTGEGTGHELKYNTMNDTLKIIIFSLEMGYAIGPGTYPLLNIEYSGKGPEMLSCSAAGYNGERVHLTVDYVTDIGNQDDDMIPSRFALSQNYPNPFNLNTRIGFALPKRCDWELKIFNIQGQMVKSFEGSYAAGIVEIDWDGTNNAGGIVSSGIYFYRLRAGEFADTKKMIILK